MGNRLLGVEVEAATHESVTIASTSVGRAPRNLSLTSAKAWISMLAPPTQ
jgi:hypothetical protein